PLYLVTFGQIAPLGLTGMLLTAPRWRSLVLIYLVVFGYMGTVLLFFNFARFRIPIVPFLCVFASAAIVTLARQAAAWMRGGAKGSNVTAPPRASPLLGSAAFLVLAWITVNYVGTVGTGVWPT